MGHLFSIANCNKLPEGSSGSWLLRWYDYCSSHGNTNFDPARRGLKSVAPFHEHPNATIGHRHELCACTFQDDPRNSKDIINWYKYHQHPTWTIFLTCHWRVWYGWRCFFFVHPSALRHEWTVRTWRGLPQRLHGEDGAGRSWKHGSQLRQLRQRLAPTMGEPVKFLTRNHGSCTVLPKKKQCFTQHVFNQKKWVRLAWFNM